MSPVYREHYDLMMSSGFYAAAVEQGLLIAHEEVDCHGASESAYKVLKPVQLPFISYPYEWSFSQLKDAGLLTLQLQKLAMEFGLSLKDASAYNVQFFQGAPIFIDTLSFEKFPEGRPWVAYKQFNQHFLAPLSLMSYRNVDLSKLLRIYVDGIPLEIASSLLPLRTRFRPSLYVHIHLHAKLQRKHSDDGDSAKKPRERSISRIGLLGIIDNLESGIRKLEWQPEGTEWSEYYDATNYTEDARDEKSRLVEAYILEIEPRSVWDLGANTGVYSRLASSRGIDTLAFDVDPAAVEKNYREQRDRHERHILPLVMDLTNPSPNLGWNGEERASLRDRGPADLAMALALIHHLAISNNVPLDRVAEFFHGICRALIIEFVPKDDSQVKRLLSTREDIFPNYTREGFEDAFARFFTIRRATPIGGSARTLYLMERSP